MAVPIDRGLEDGEVFAGDVVAEPVIGNGVVVPPVLDDQPTLAGTLADLNGNILTLNDRLAPREPEPLEITPSEIPAAITNMLQHEDPAVREYARWTYEQMRTMNERIEQVGQGANEAQVEAVAMRLEHEIAQAVGAYGLTSVEERVVVDYLTSDPSLAKTLTFEEGIRRIFPDRTPRVASRVTSAAPAGASPSLPRQPGTVIGGGTAAGTVPTPWKPDPRGSIEQAVKEGGRRLFGV